MESKLSIPLTAPPARSFAGGPYIAMALESNEGVAP